MDDNPYKSPVSLSEGETPLSQPVKRYGRAAVSGFLAWGGLVWAQAVVWSILTSELAIKDTSPFDAPLLLMAAIASPLGAAMAWWTWRNPESAWPYGVAMLLALSGSLLGLILSVFFAHFW